MAVEWLTSGWTGSVASYTGTENDDGGATGLTLGTHFSPVKAGNITHIRFWKTSIDTATSRTVGIFDFTGTLFTSTTTSGEPVGTAQWIDVTLTTPLAVSNASALTVNYIAAVYYAQQRYPATSFVFSGGGSPNGQSKYTSPNAALYSPGDGEGGSGNNALFHYGSGISQPDGSFNSAWYWVDVGWEASGGSTQALTGKSIGSAFARLTPPTGKAAIGGKIALGSVTRAGIGPKTSLAGKTQAIETGRGVVMPIMAMSGKASGDASAKGTVGAKANMTGQTSSRSKASGLIGGAMAMVARATAMTKASLSNPSAGVSLVSGVIKAGSKAQGAISVQAVAALAAASRIASAAKTSVSGKLSLAGKATATTFGGQQIVQKAKRVGYMLIQSLGRMGM